MKDFLLQTKYVSAFGLAEDDVLNTLNSLRGKQPRYFGGYASSLYAYAQTARKHGIDDVTFSGVISWGDKMFAHYRDLIEKQFRTRVTDTYGTTEGFMIAGQKDLPYYYIISPHVYLELLNEEGQEVADGELGQVVVTSLDAFEMPLVRYYLGDLAVKLPRDRYPKERALQFPLLERIIGRDTDIVTTPSGKRMIVHFFTAIFEHVPEIAQFRIIQSEADSMTIEYIKSNDFKDAVLDFIKDQIENYLGEPFKIRFDEVSLIPSSPSGKPQIIVSKLKNGNGN